MNSTTHQYSAELQEILGLEVPTPRKIKESFLDITGQQFKENSISKVYAYFLNQEKNPGTAALFIYALLNLIRAKSSKALVIDTFTCSTEEGTKNRNRIDLIINSSTEKKCIVIENKIFHHLHNDLQDYWNHKPYLDENKAGVLLTLKRHHIPDNVRDKFVNITHIEWITEVKKRGLPHEIDPRQHVYLTDFIRHIENISEINKMNEQVRFYFENKEKVKRAIHTYDEAVEYVKGQMRIVAEKLDWEFSGSGSEWCHIWDSKNKPEVYYAIEFAKLLWEEQEINIIIEFYKDAVNKAESIRQKYKNDNRFNLLKDEGRAGSGWLHFSNFRYPLSGKDIESLADFVFDKIQQDFKPVMDILLKETSKK